MRWLTALLAAGLIACGRTEKPEPAGRAADTGPAAELVAGEALFWRDEFDRAGATFQTALVRARASSDTAGEARALTWLGRLARERGDYEAARRDGEAGLSLKLGTGLTADLFDSYNALGLLAWNQGRLIAAESLLTAASRSAAASGDHLSVAKASGNLGLVKVELGDYQGARVGLEAMLVAGRAAGDDRVEGNALANLAMLDIREGDPRDAVPRLMEAGRFYQRIDYRPGRANMLGQLATAWRDLGDYQSAFAAADSALVLAREEGLRQEEAAELEVIATLHSETGDHTAALRRLVQAQVINHALGLQVEDGTVRRRVAELQLELGQRAVAIAGGVAALGIHAEVGAQPERLQDLLFLAQADSANSARWLRDAGTLVDSMKSARAMLELSLADAQVALAAGDGRRALRAIAPASAYRRPLSQFDRWRIAETEARVYRAVGDLARAELAASRAVGAVERTRSSMGASWSRARLLASRAESYTDLVEILLARGRLADALVTADAAHGQVLLEHLGSLDTAKTTPGSLLAHLARRERTLRRIDDLEQQLAALPDDASPEVAETSIRLRRRLSELQAEYTEAAALQFPSSAAVGVLGGGRLDLAKLQALLVPGEALVEYLIGARQVHLFVVSPTGVYHHVLPTTPRELASRVRIARDLASRAGPTEMAAPVLGALYQQLIAPALGGGGLKGVTRLIVVPHGILGYLPFSALLDERRGRYLVEDLVLSTVPSAGALIALRDEARRNSLRSERVVALAPFPSTLPGTAAEVEEIARVVPGAEILVGLAATEAAARRSAGLPGIVHLATHGVLNPDNPLFSRVELRSGTEGASAVDGRLEVHEVLALRLDARLVYLSGCETALGGLGVFARGDDFVGLGQSFLFAGARSAVATLWRTSDTGSVPLVGAFFEELGRTGPAEAMARAQRRLIGSPRYSSPYYWAGHVLAGDGNWN